MVEFWLVWLWTMESIKGDDFCKWGAVFRVFLDDFLAVELGEISK